MLIKIAALAAAGYAGYRYFSQDRGTSRVPSRTTPEHDAVAGGPLSAAARVQHSPQAPSTAAGTQPGGTPPVAF